MYRLQGKADGVARQTVVALGSNVGDRHAHLDYAVARLRSLLVELRVSPFIETAPHDVAPQAAFLNGVVVGGCALAPDRLLLRLLEIEDARGRTRPAPGAPRTLDLDLILMGTLVIDAPGLALPHPRFRERRFVLEPLAAVAPDLRDPVSGRSVQALLSRLGGR